MVAKSLGIPVDLQRYWICNPRLNGLFRPSRPLTPTEEGKKLMELRSLSDCRVRGGGGHKGKRLWTCAGG